MISGSKSSGFQISSIEVVAPVFQQAFGDSLDINRLSAAHIVAVLGSNEIPIAAAAIEKNGGRSWHCWLLAVDEKHRHQGLGRLLLRHVIDLATTEGAGSVWLKSFKKWKPMQTILQKDGWHLCGAEVAGRHDGVREIWRFPILRNPIDVVVIGANPVGRGAEWIERIRTLPTMFRVQAIIDGNPGCRDHWQRLGFPVFGTLQELPESAQPAAAVIAVPPTAVAGVQKQCIQLGISYLVEKPMAGSLAELADLQAQLQNSNVCVAVGVQRRSHPSYVALKSVLSGHGVTELSVQITLGRPVEDRPAGHRGDRSQCRGGALLDLGYHALDLVHFLLGHPLELVSCSLTTSGDLALAIESAASVLGRCGKTWVRIDVDRHGSAKTELVHARTEEGVWTVDREKVLRPDGSCLYHCSGSWEKAEAGTLASLAGAIATGKSEAMDLWEHLALFELVERAYASAYIHGLEGFAP